MKLISAAIALLASAAVVSSSPIYDTYSTEPSSTYGDGSSPTPTGADCVGFKITSQTESDITWVENSNQEVIFEFESGTKITTVEYVDLVTYDSHKVVDEWATGPWSSSNPRTGLHELHTNSGESGSYQFLVYAATQDHQHCTYLSGKFTITPSVASHRGYGSYDESSSPDSEPSSTSTYDDHDHNDDSEPSTTYDSSSPTSTGSDEFYPYDS